MYAKDHWCMRYVLTAFSGPGVRVLVRRKSGHATSIGRLDQCYTHLESRGLRQASQNSDSRERSAEGCTREGSRRIRQIPRYEWPLSECSYVGADDLMQAHGFHFRMDGLLQKRMAFWRDYCPSLTTSQATRAPLRRRSMLQQHRNLEQRDNLLPEHV